MAWLGSGLVLSQVIQQSSNTSRSLTRPPIKNEAIQERIALFVNLLLTLCVNSAEMEIQRLHPGSHSID